MSADLPFATRILELELGPRSLRLLVPREPEEVFAAYLDREDPFWSELWPSAQALARHCFGLRRLPLQEPVLDLGTGLGLTALALAACGLRVTASDASAACLALVERSARLNGLEALVETQLHSWGAPLPQRFGSAVGADLLYGDSEHANLRVSLCQAVAPGGMIWLADPDRPPSRRFFEQLPATWQVVSQPLEGRILLHSVKHNTQAETPA